MAGADPKAAHALVTDLLSIAGITAVGGRSVGEIADRFLEQSTLGAFATLPPYTRALVERFLAVSGNPLDASVTMREIASDGGLMLTPALDLFDTRNVELGKRGVDLDAHRLLVGIRSRHGLLHRLRIRTHRRRVVRTAGRGRALRRPDDAAGIALDPFRRRLLGLDRTTWREAQHDRAADHRRPRQGTLAGKCRGFFARAGLRLVKSRGVRDYRGAIEGMDGVEIAYLSASEITTQLAQGAAHMGVTGEDLVREMIPDADARGDPARRPALRLRQCRGRGAASVDRCAQHGRSRRCRDRIPDAP